MTKNYSLSPFLYDFISAYTNIQKSYNYFFNKFVLD